MMTCILHVGEGSMQLATSFKESDHGVLSFGFVDMTYTSDSVSLAYWGICLNIAKPMRTEIRKPACKPWPP